MALSLKLFLDGLSEPLKDAVLPELEKVAKGFAVDFAAKGSAQVILKGIDGSIAAIVKHLSRSQAEEFAEAYRAQLAEELAELSQAITFYMPLQLDVEWQKKVHGSKSDEANAARARRQEGINALRQETKDLLLAAIGETPAD